MPQETCTEHDCVVVYEYSYGQRGASCPICKLIDEKDEQITKLEDKVAEVEANLERAKEVQDG